jgi:hypothetical protein
MNYPSEMQEKMQAAIKQGAINGAQGLNLGVSIGLPPRAKAPVEESMNRLFEYIGKLQAEVDQLTDRLAPVSRPDSTAGNAASDRSPSECMMVDMLDQASERVVATIRRVSDARDRLCI